MDLLLVINMFNGKVTVPWELQSGILEIRRGIQQIKLVHCYREGNYVADALAKFGSINRGLPIPIIFDSVQNMPKEASGAYRMDMAHFPTFRIRQEKIGKS